MSVHGRPGSGLPPSPCIKVCAMDAEDRFCTGCGRTRAEIAQWWLLGDDAKRAVLAALPARCPQGGFGGVPGGKVGPGEGS